MNGRSAQAANAAALRPYVPRVTVDWFRDAPELRHRVIEGSLVFVDVSGFTKLSERLAKRGRIGAEQLTEAISNVFTELLASAYAEGGSLLKFGGDALLLLFTGDGHAVHACRAANGMRAELRRCGVVDTGSGTVKLKMSAGVHSGHFGFFLAGTSHRELLITGPDATTTVRMEGTATAGQVVISEATAALVGPKVLGPAVDGGYLLRKVAIPGDVAAPAVTSEPLPPDVDLSPLFSAPVREHLLGGAGEAEHRVVTVAFVHYDGTDHLVEQDGFAAVAGALDELLATVQSACDEHGVTFLGSDLDADGGKVILLSGAPRATENDEDRMLGALRRIADTPGRLPVRIGVNSGHVFTGDVGPAYRRTYTVMGDTVNVAARLMAAASAGEIYSSQSVLDRSGRFETTALEPLTLKGKAKPFPAFAVGAYAPGRRDDADDTVDLPLVGRDDERRVIADALLACRDGNGSVIELVGDPGIGKSRLVREAYALAGDIERATVACEAYESADAYWAVRELLRDRLALDGAPAVAAGQLREFVARAAPELVPALPLLGTALGLPIDDTDETAALEPQFRRERVAGAVAQLACALFDRPALLVFEDVHWIDDASADVLVQIAAGAADRPWCVLVTGRDGAPSPLAETDGVARLALTALPADVAVRLIEAATEDAPLLPQAAVAIAERAGGNPLFLEELAKATSAVGDALGSVQSVSAVITAQLDLLPRSRRRLIGYASVLGRRFEVQMLEALIGTPLPNRRAGMWREVREYLRWDDEHHLEFRQSLIRDAAYERLTFRERRGLHARAGEALEQQAGADPDAYAAVLSRHFLEAHRYEDAWRHACSGADRAAASYANAEAAELYERALAAARYVAGIDDETLADTWAELGDVSERGGRFEVATKAYRAARRLSVGDPIAQAELLLKEAWIAERVSRLSEALRWIRRGERCLAGEHGAAAARQRAQLAVWYAVIRQAQGHHAAAIRAAERAIDEAKACDETSVLAHAYLVLDWAYVESGHPERAVYSSEALRIYEELGDLAHQAAALNNLGGLAYYDGRWRDALDLYERGRDARARTGDAVEVARGTVNIGEILSDQGRLDAAESMLQDARRVWRAAGYRAGVPFVTMLLARVASRARRFGDAHALFDEARDALLAVGAEGELLMADAYRAECLAFEGRHEDAVYAVDDVLARAPARGEHSLAPLLLRVTGIAAAQRGDAEGALAALDGSCVAARNLAADHEVALTLDVMVQLGDLAGTDVTDARRERDEIFARLDVQWTPDVPLAPRPAVAVPSAP